MAKKGKQKKERQPGPGAQKPVDVGPVKKPLLVAQLLSVVLLLVGLVMMALAGGVLAGRITDGWGFPMSAVSNWGRPWGAVLLVAAAAYVVGPFFLLARPRNGSIALIIICGLSVLVGTPIITTTTEIFYNLFQETKSRPDWVDSVWGYFMIINVAIAVSLCKAYPLASETTATANEGKPSPPIS